MIGNLLRQILYLVVIKLYKLLFSNSMHISTTLITPKYTQFTVFLYLLVTDQTV